MHYMMRKLLSFSIAVMGVAGSLPAAAFIIDGKLDDWGVDTKTWIPADGIQFTIEDQIGVGAYYLTPGWGGQAYDAEALYAKKADGKVYIALATGHNPRTLNQGNSYGAGDFAIDFNKDGSFDVGINILHAEGFKKGAYTFETFGVEGGVYKNPVWAYGLWDTAGNLAKKGNADCAHPTHMTGGTQVGQAELKYTTVGVAGYGQRSTDLHYFYEMSIDTGLLFAAGWDGKAFDIHWTQNCANDSIFVDPPGNVPAPTTLALMGLGLFGLIQRRTQSNRRRR